MKNKDVKNLIIYLALSFGMTWIIFFGAIAGGFRWGASNGFMESFVALGMLMPLIAHLFTRMITKEGLQLTGEDSMMLGIDLKNKKWIIYLFAIFIPYIYQELGNVLLIAIVPESFGGTAENLPVFQDKPYLISLVSISSAVVTSFAALGEEGGWRGYMMPKLIKIMGLNKAIIVGGIIWGLWHAPLTCIGHNFGTDYPGFPYVGILLMCCSCIFVGSILTFVTVKTKSIWPATFMHAVNNASSSILDKMLDEEVILDQLGIFSYWLISLVPMLIVAVVVMVILNRKNQIGK
ncbi:MAG: CPBP family intramembrane metalloprotease [Saccharofermentans sp.]|nr:CPBP family intramembrane metalloprotease [Saccharofermentans sp.]